jgi:hypothetical protein
MSFFTPSSPIASSIISTDINLSFSEDNNSQLSSEKDRFNSIDFILPPPEKTNIYIFQQNLFTRTLLPIEVNKDRQILVSCTQ